VLGLTIEIRGDTKNLDSALNSSEGSVGGFGAQIGGSALKLAAFAGVAGTAVVALKGMAEGAAADQAEQDRLTAAIAAATGSTVDQTAAVDAAIAAGQERAFTDSQTRDALQSLVTSTGDLTAATGLLGTAQDIARFAGVDLATAADAVAKANAGQDGALRKMLPGLAQGATATDTLANAQALAAGQADAYGKTTEGAMAKSADAVGELGETVGSALLPMLDAILPALIPVIQSLGKLIQAILPILIPLLKLVGQAFAVVAGAIAGLVGWLTTLIGWISRAMDMIGGLLAKIGPLRDLGNLVGGIVGGLSSSAVAGPSAQSTSSSSGGGGGTSIVFNITATGDSLDTERAVLNALRRTTRLNAGSVPSWSSSS
jgi:hypothetical protein